MTENNTTGTSPGSSNFDAASIREAIGKVRTGEKLPEQADMAAFNVLAERGFSLIRTSGKIPTDTGWQKACKDRAVYDPKRYNGFNAGVACGPASGVIVLDIDDFEKFSAYTESKGFCISDTFSVATGRDAGGLHHYYQYPTDGKKYGCVGQKPNGFEIKGFGGYVVGPGSIHPDTHRCYKVLHNIPVVPAPDWLLSLACKESEKPPPKKESPGGSNIERLKAVLPRIENVVELKPHSGVELAGPCPRCGGRDRFVVWVDKQDFWCRADGAGCGWKGDAIDFFCDHFKTDLSGLIKMFLKPEGNKATDNATRQGKGAVYTTMSDILGKDYPEPEWLITGLLPRGGICLFGGKPKAGKSLLTVNLAISLSTGGKAIGGVDVDKEPVLLLALEDTERRLKSRVAKMTLQGVDLKNLIVCTNFRKFGAGGESDLEEMIQLHKPALVIVDTLKKIRAIEKSGKQIYDADYEAIDAFNPFARKHKCTFIIVTHLRKLEAEDPFDTFSGSLGLTAAADTLWVLQRQRNRMILYGKGRDMEPFEKAVQLDVDTLVWRILGDADEIQKSDSQQKIYDVLKESDAPLKPTAIHKLSGVKYEVVKQLVRKMLSAGSVQLNNQGYYIVNRSPPALAYPIILGFLEEKHSPRSPHSPCSPRSPRSPGQTLNGVNDTPPNLSPFTQDRSPFLQNDINSLTYPVNAVNEVNGFIGVPQNAPEDESYEVII